MAEAAQSRIRQHRHMIHHPMGRDPPRDPLHLSHRMDLHPLLCCRAQDPRAAPSPSQRLALGCPWDLDPQEHLILPLLYQASREREPLLDCKACCATQLHWDLDPQCKLRLEPHSPTWAGTWDLDSQVLLTPRYQMRQPLRLAGQEQHTPTWEGTWDLDPQVQLTPRHRMRHPLR